MITSTDQLNRNIFLQNIPVRIVSLVPSLTELLFDLGLNEEVIGITKFCTHPEEWFRSKVRVGGTKNINIETIRKLNPDLVIANKEENTGEQIGILANNFPVWISDIRNLIHATNMIAEISKLVNRENTGIDLLKKIKNEFDVLQSVKTKLISCSYLIWKNPLMTAGGDTFISEMLKCAGYSNVFAGQNRYPVIGYEDLRKQNPEILLLSSEPFPFKEKHKAQFSKELPNTKILLVDGEMFSWYGSRLAKAASYFKQLREKIESAL